MASSTNLSNRVLLDAESFSEAQLAGVLARVNALVEANPNPRAISFGPGHIYLVDYAKMASAVSALNVTLQQKDGRVTHGDVRTVADFLVPLDDTKENRRLIGRLPSYNPTLYQPSPNWPVKGVMPGAGIVVGDTGSGKTSFLLGKSAEKVGVDVLVRYGEPLEYLDRENYVVHAGSLVEAVSLALLLSAYGAHVAVDSLRSLVYGLSGNAMEGGMVASLFDVLTQLNNLVAELGTVVLFAVNPMLADQSKADRLFVRIAASVAGAYHIVEGKVHAQTFRLDSGRFWGTQPSRRVEDEALAGPPNVGIYHQLDSFSEDDVRTHIAAGLTTHSPYESADSQRSAAPFTL